MKDLKHLAFYKSLELRKMKYIHLQLLFIGVCIGMFSQKSKNINLANDKFDNYSYVEARELYLDLIEEGTRSALILKKIGDSYYFNNDYHNAMEWYSELITKYPGEDYEVDYLFRYAQTLKSMHLYDEAKNVMNTFYHRKGIVDENQQEKGLYNKYNKRVKLIPFHYNSKFSDHAPQFGNKDQLFFSSARDTLSKIHEWNKEPFLDIYSLKNGKVSKFEGNVNTKYHESSIAFSPSMDTIYFTRNDTENLNNNLSNLSIYRAYAKDDTNLNFVEPLSINNSKYSVAHPAISPDGKKIIFASDMPGGYGSTDLYEGIISRKGKIKKVKNLGPKINTFGRETFPSFDSHGNLYFSSDGHEGLGGLDVFIFKPKTDGSKQIFNLGKPINSGSDDFSFIYDPVKKQGYFSSNRPGGLGGDDIYGFKKYDSNCKGNTLYGTIFQDGNSKIINNATITVFDEDMNVLKKLVTHKNSYYLNLECSQNIVLRIEKKGFRTKEIFYKKSKFETTSIIEQHFFMHSGVNFKQFNTEKVSFLDKQLIFDAIYFNVNSSVFDEKSKQELRKLVSFLNEFDQVKILISAYADSRGSNTYNQKLSEKRAREIKKYLITQGIHTRRIITKAYGENNLASKCIKNCNDEIYQQNRRCDLKILI